MKARIRFIVIFFGSLTALLILCYLPFFSYSLKSLPIQITVLDKSTKKPVPGAQVMWRDGNPRSGFWWLREIGVTNEAGVLEFEEAYPQRILFGTGKYTLPFDIIYLESDEYIDSNFSVSNQVGEIPLSSPGVKLKAQIFKRKTRKKKRTFTKGLRMPNSDWAVPIYKTQKEADIVSKRAILELKKLNINAFLVSPSPSLSKDGFEPSLETASQRHISVWVDKTGSPVGVNFAGPNIINSNIKVSQSWVVDFEGNIIYLESNDGEA